MAAPLSLPVIVQSFRAKRRMTWNGTGIALSTELESQVVQVGRLDCLT